MAKNQLFFVSNGFFFFVTLPFFLTKFLDNSLPVITNGFG